MIIILDDRPNIPLPRYEYLRLFNALSLRRCLMKAFNVMTSGIYNNTIIAIYKNGLKLLFASEIFILAFNLLDKDMI
jgi:hypothetical protein